MLVFFFKMETQIYIFDWLSSFLAASMTLKMIATKVNSSLFNLKLTYFIVSFWEI